MIDTKIDNLFKTIKESKEYQYNLARQQFLNLNGIKVKLDGSWGPW